ncbi:MULTISPECIES: OmpA family protein [unclassified Duganella]|uniref:OmpA family protein n=1 Tax=unclassified Duganella TaxID=2636909 RepID=UPI0006F4FB52|nr:MULTISPECIES: OmpA family protein [unclassified Duganella]KQV45359.1 cell envelope biogenesis protein OmpA [Duganella sp. Root336D2]KRC02723.1 cell envelope biogenesis protein OmpA [Duganella sp. Root198D2]
MRYLPLLLLCAAFAVQAQIPGQVVASGTVADEASKTAVLAKLREVYGADKVLDQITVGQVTTPANWGDYVQKLITPDLKQVSRGQLKVDGTTVSVRGEVANEALRQRIASDFATRLNPTYTVTNGLRVSAADQGVLDRTLANRIVEFESGQAVLTPTGRTILDEMGSAMLKLKGQKVEIIGHTDNVGLRTSNQNLSQARAEAVRNYLAGKGIPAETLVASGSGPDRPIASNDTVEGRARNRRIEFRMAQ